jgi:hypothetical protein
MSVAVPAVPVVMTTRTYANNDLGTRRRNHRSEKYQRKERKQ